MESPLELAADHPAYRGHFPGRPVLPGVVLLAEVMHAVALGTGSAIDGWTIANAKFLQPVTPGAPLVLSHQSTANGGIRFEVRGASGVVASGTLSPRR